VNDLTR